VVVSSLGLVRCGAGRVLASLLAVVCLLLGCFLLSSAFCTTNYLLARFCLRAPTLLSLLIPMPALLLFAAPLTSYLPSILPNWDYNMSTCSYEDVEESYLLHYAVDYIAILPLN
jgi:hypothetical protein